MPSLTSIFINGVLPEIPNMKKLDDFKIKNYFKNMPTISATPFAGYYFGDPAGDITMNSFDEDKSAAVHGSLNNQAGLVAVDVNNYLDTAELAPVKFTLGISFKRPEKPIENTWLVADFSGSGTQGRGFALGIGANGKLRLAAQNADAISVAEVDFPTSVPVGDMCGVTCFVRQGSATVAIYSPLTGKYDSVNSSVSGTRPTGTNSILLGRKSDSNTDTSPKIEVKSLLLMDGELSVRQHIAIQKYLIAM